ncbi:MAG: glycosyltransferase [Alphaproteobacteria bacterium]
MTNDPIAGPAPPIRQGGPPPAEIEDLRRKSAAADAEIGRLRNEIAAMERRRIEYDRLLIGELDAMMQGILAAARPDAGASGAEPEISVVMPVWNRSDAVGRAIRSVLAQTFASWELLIVDDGSTDGLAAALEGFRDDPRIRTFRQAHAGVSAARNLALRHARGVLVAYLDSDNFWYPRFLEGAATVFRADPDLDVGYAGIAYEWPDGRIDFALPRFDRPWLLEHNIVDLNVLVHRRRLFERLGGFDEELERAVDWDLLLRYTAHRPPARIPAVGARYCAAGAERISTTVPLGPNAFRLRRKWWPRPAVAPRVLYAASHPLQPSEDDVCGEIACLRRLGAAIEIFAPERGAAALPHDVAVHRGAIADAIRAAAPDVVHVRDFAAADRHRAALAAAGVPVTVRDHDFEPSPELVRRVLEIPHLRRAYLLPGGAAPPRDEKLASMAPCFDTALFRPARRKDPKLVLRAASQLTRGAAAFVVDLAKRLPEHRVVLAIARGAEADADAVRALAAGSGSPVELVIGVERREMAALFDAAGIYLHGAAAPADAAHARLGAPVSIAEAMATGAYVLVRDVPALKRYVGDAGAAYDGLEEAAALIRATRAWSDAQWRQARLRAVERAFEFHADEIVLRPLFDDWCAIARERHAARAPAPPAA